MTKSAAAQGSTLSTLLFTVLHRSVRALFATGPAGMAPDTDELPARLRYDVGLSDLRPGGPAQVRSARAELEAARDLLRRSY